MLVLGKTSTDFCKTSRRNLNVQGNGLSASANSTFQGKVTTTTGQVGRAVISKKTKSTRSSDKRALFPELCYQWRQRQRCENLSDICLSSSSYLPYQTQGFKSSTVYKKVNLPGHYHTRFLENNKEIFQARGFMLHTSRYGWPNKKSDPLLGPTDKPTCTFLKPLQPIYHKQMTIPTARMNNLHVVLGGKKIEMEERFNLMQEIQRLKCLVLPNHARDLFHGKGFKLPTSHGSLKPRRTFIQDDEGETTQAEVQQNLPKCQLKTLGNKPKQGTGQLQCGLLPHLNKSFTFAGNSASSPVKLSKERAFVRRLKIKLNMASSSPPISTPSTLLVLETKRTTRDTTREALNNAQDNRSINEDRKSDKDNLELTQNSSPVNPSSMISREVENEDVQVWKTEERLPLIHQHSPRLTASQELDSDNKNEDMTPDQRESNTPKPWTETDLVNVPSSEQDILKKTFNQLDTDKDGHLLYTQLKSQLPAVFSGPQEKFVKVVYDIIAHNTFFGVSEFVGMSQLTKTIETLSGPALEAYGVLNFDHLEDTIYLYLNDFQSGDPGCRGSISLDSLCTLVSTQTGQSYQTDASAWNNVLANISLTEVDSIKKTTFLAHIPYFLSLKKKQS